MSANPPPPIAIDEPLLDVVTHAARLSPRLRRNHNFHTADTDACHRLLNGMEPGSYILPHRHLDPNKDETFVILRGAFGLVLFDDAGEVAQMLLLRAGGTTLGATVPSGTWHTLIAFEPGGVFLEAKAGPVPAAFRCGARAVGSGGRRCRGRGLSRGADRAIRRLTGRWSLPGAGPPSGRGRGRSVEHGWAGIARGPREIREQALGFVEARQDIARPFAPSPRRVATGRHDEFHAAFARHAGRVLPSDTRCNAMRCPAISRI
jgi:cupin fold WbuC family metalloprotein